MTDVLLSAAIAAGIGAGTLGVLYLFVRFPGIVGPLLMWALLTFVIWALRTH